MMPKPLYLYMMISLIKRAIGFFIIKPGRRIESFVNKAGKKRKCYICGNHFKHFIKYHGGTKNSPDFIKKLDIVGSDIDNFGCPFCSSHDRERHLYMFFDKLQLWQEMTDLHILHFAPEIHLSGKIESSHPAAYIKADIDPRQHDIKMIDATDIPFHDETMDMVICNHVLEHIPDYLKAIHEIYRVLKTNGTAILQTPCSRLLYRNFEDKNINTAELRLFFYGEKNHYRVFSEQNFFRDLTDAGFELKIMKSPDFFDDRTSYYYGINKKEDLIIVKKPGR
jgi:SAM-dependent methyltransferase